MVWYSTVAYTNDIGLGSFFSFYIIVRTSCVTRFRHVEVIFGGYGCRWWCWWCSAEATRSMDSHLCCLHTSMMQKDRDDVLLVVMGMQLVSCILVLEIVHVVSVGIWWEFSIPWRKINISELEGKWNKMLETKIFQNEKRESFQKVK